MKTWEISWEDGKLGTEIVESDDFPLEAIEEIAESRNVKKLSAREISNGGRATNPPQSPLQPA